MNLIVQSVVSHKRGNTRCYHLRLHNLYHTDANDEFDEEEQVVVDCGGSCSNNIVSGQMIKLV